VLRTHGSFFVTFLPGLAARVIMALRNAYRPSGVAGGFDAEMFRLRPKRIVSWGIDGTMMQQNARSVG